MNEYTWKVNKLDCYPNKAGEKDVVFTVHWSLSGTDNTYVSSIISSTSLNLDPEASFTPYDQLTEEMVLEWVWNSGVDKKSAEQTIDKMLKDQENPPVVSPPLPWA